MEEQHHIRRWNLPNAVYEFPIDLMLRTLLGYNEYTWESIRDILDYQELRDRDITPETRYTIAINDDIRCITLQKVPNHGGGRDTTILYEKGIVKFIPGDEYKHKGKR